tara:strand:- start:598 stop:1263 length:666 start_codon:yes stop_codon:yes gene_type:complete
MSLQKWVVVFDLDDTLISELDYQYSGIKAVEKMLSDLNICSLNNSIMEAKSRGVKDLWAWICNEKNLPMSIKESILWTYRLHSPSIKLFSGVDELLIKLKKYNANIAILTDGRSISQRLKINALGLNNIPLFISEEFQSLKPDRKKFLAVEKSWPKFNYAYIADNPCKDFYTPKQLNWITIGADWVIERLYSRKLTSDTFQEPDIWLKDPLDVASFLLNLK